MKSTPAFSFAPALLWWEPELSPWCRWSLPLPGWLLKESHRAGILLGKGACNFRASLTSFSRELPGKFWPGAVACCYYCGGGTGGMCRLEADFGCPCPKQRCRGVWGSGVTSVSWAQTSLPACMRNDLRLWSRRLLFQYYFRELDFDI